MEHRPEEEGTLPPTPPPSAEPTPEAGPSPTADAAPSEEASEAPPPDPPAPAEPPGEQASPAPEESSVATMLTEAVEAEPKAVIPKKGARISGKIIRIGEDGAFVDFGGREEGFLDVRELHDEKGSLTKAVGDDLQATVVATEGGIKLSLKGGKRSGNVAAVLEAQKSNLPVEGKVTGVNKGGLVVRVMGVRAFCPFSQIDRHYIDDPSQYVGQRLTFRVSSADARGKNVVLSRRTLLEEGMKERAEELRQRLELGNELEGVVARIRPFGAFVDLGGVDGLVHVSEISHNRVKDPSEVLKVGESVRVKILKIDDLGGKNERISLSIKQLQDSPWDAAAKTLTPGERIRGEVVRIVDFGAFVGIAPGVDGLIHVSAMATGRVDHPSEVVKVGEGVEAWVVNVDVSSRRISLSLVDPAERPERPSGKPRERSGGRRREGREAIEAHLESRKTDTGMTSMEEAFQRLRDRRNET